MRGIQRVLLGVLVLLLGSFLGAANSHATPPNQTNIPKCGWTQNQKEIPYRSWAPVLEVEIKHWVSSTEAKSVRGFLCAAWVDKSAYLVDLISFHSSEGFDEIFKVEELMKKSKTLFTNDDLAKITVGSHLIRAGELLTLNLTGVKDLEEESVYNFSLRFPKQIFWNVFSQSDEFYDFPFNIHREQGTEKLYAEVTDIIAAPKGVCKRVTLEIPYREVAVKQLTLNTDEKDGNIFLKDLKIKTGAFASLPNKKSAQAIEGLIAKDEKYLKQLEKERQSYSSSLEVPVFRASFTPIPY